MAERDDARVSGGGCVQCSEGKDAVDKLKSEYIARSGFFVPYVTGGDGAPFAYTVGFTETFNSPEIIIIGNFPQRLINDIIGSVAETLKKNSHALDAEGEIDGGWLRVTKNGVPNGDRKKAKFGCRFITKKNEEKYCGQLYDRYSGSSEGGPRKRTFRVMQIILYDQQGKLPWHEGFNEKWATYDAEQIDLYDAKHKHETKKVKSSLVFPRHQRGT
jgi:hypothetical protein